MIGSDHVETSGYEPLEEGVPSSDVADGRIDLVLGAGAAIHLEQEMMKRDLRGESRGLGEIQALGRGEMAYVDVRTSEMLGETGYGGRLGCCGTVAEMVPATILLPLRYEMVVLGVDGHAEACGERIPHRRDHLLVVIQEDVSCRGSHEQLESDSERSEHPGVYPCGHGREQSVIGHSLPADYGLLLLERAHIDHGGLGIWHVEHAGHPCMDRCHRPCPEVLLGRHPGIAEVHVRIYERGHHDLAGPQLHPALSSGHVIAGGDNPPLLGDPYLGVPDLAVDEGPAFQHDIDIAHLKPSLRDRPEPPRSRSLP